MPEEILAAKKAEPVYICADSCAIGPIQCSPGATTYWKGCEGVSKVLDDEGEESLEGA